MFCSILLCKNHPGCSSHHGNPSSLRIAYCTAMNVLQCQLIALKSIHETPDTKRRQFSRFISFQNIIPRTTHQTHHYIHTSKINTHLHHHLIHIEHAYTGTTSALPRPEARGFHGRHYKARLQGHRVFWSWVPLWGLEGRAGRKALRHQDCKLTILRPHH